MRERSVGWQTWTLAAVIILAGVVLGVARAESPTFVLNLVRGEPEEYAAVHSAGGIVTMGRPRHRILVRRSTGPTLSGSISVRDGEGVEHSLLLSSVESHVVVGEVHSVSGASENAGIRIVCCEPQDAALGERVAEEVSGLLGQLSETHLHGPLPGIIVVSRACRHYPKMWRGAPAECSNLITGGDCNGSSGVAHSVARIVAVSLLGAERVAEVGPEGVAFVGQGLQMLENPDAGDEQSRDRAARWQVMRRHLLAAVRSKGRYPDAEKNTHWRYDRESFDQRVGIAYRALAALEIEKEVRTAEQWVERSLGLTTIMVSQSLRDRVREEFASESERVEMDPVATGASDLVIRFASGYSGYLEDCGCKSRKSAGFAGLMQAVGASTGVTNVFAGNVVASPHTRRHSELITGFMAAKAVECGAVVVPSLNEIMNAVALRSVPHFSWTIANVQGTGVPSEPSRAVKAASGAVTHIVGVYDPAGSLRTSDVSEFAERFRWRAPLTVVQEIQRRVPDGEGLIVVGNWWPRAEELAQLGSDVTVVCANYRIGGHKVVSRKPWLGEWVLPQKGRATLVGCDTFQYGANELRLGSGGSPEWVSRAFPGEVSDAGLEVELEELWASGAGLSRDLSPFLNAESELASRRGYIGSQACAGCHASQYAAWKETPHARSMTTLMKVQRHRAAACVRCHVVGFGLPSGYSTGRVEGLSAVGCEACHGPGKAHAAGERGQIIGRPTQARCVECHDREHSDMHLSPQSYLDRCAKHCLSGKGNKSK